MSCPHPHQISKREREREGKDGMSAAQHDFKRLKMYDDEKELKIN